MKKLFILLGITIIASLSAVCQTTRMVLVEEFTNASCGPCALQNPGFDALLKQNTDRCVCIKYHTVWPGADPMNAHNKTDVAARVSYYSINGVPMTTINSVKPLDPTNVYYEGAPHNATQAMLDAAKDIPAPVSLKVHQDFSPNADSMIITISAKVLADISGPLVLHCAVVEKVIEFNTPPGANGEKEFFDVMKKMLPSSSGTALSTSYHAGENIIQRFVWKLENVYDKSQLGVVAFIQNKSSQEILQAARDSNEPLSEFNKDVVVYNVGNVLSSYCKPVAQPTFEFFNFGNDTIRAASFRYRFNDDAEKEFTWSGKLPFLASTKVTLPETSFTLNEKNDLHVYLSSLNNSIDQNASNDTASLSFNAAPVVGGDVTVFVKTDNKPMEVSWEITDSDGNVLANEGPYSTPSKTFKTAITPEAGKCYIFNITDAGGDGLCCTSGSGLVNVSYNNGISTVYLLQAQSFGKSLSCQFYSASGVGVQKHDAALFFVYPNPVTDLMTIHFENAVDETVTTEIVNALGKVVVYKPATKYGSGSHEIMIDSRNLPAGIYTIRLTAGTKLFAKKVVIRR